MTFVRSFGELLRRHRGAAGLTQEMLAERARMSLATIGKLERGTSRRPYRATIDLLAEALSLSPEDRLELERAAHRGTHAVSNAEEDAGTAINLPIHFSSFVGRENDLAAICEMLATHRLVSLVGAGGVGKTRLAIRAAEQIVASNPEDRFDAVWFVDLSSVTKGAAVAMVLSSSIGLPQCRTIDALVAYLRSQMFLLILDNCEHVLDSIAPAAEAILSGCPGAVIVTTTRQALSIEGERVYRVPTLSCPPSETRSAAEALEYDAIRLFKDRAEAVDSRFELTDSEVPAVIEICQRVDGIALAIELAAARTNAFSPASIAQQIGEQLSLLTGGLRTALSRHKTMRALFDWSYDLLDDRERELFRRLSVFAGGFTLDLVCALYGERTEKSAIPSILASLVDKSFVQCDIHAGPRYRLLEPARQYAREKLRERGEHDGAARSHALALLALAEEFDARLDVIPDYVWDERIERERENFRAAFEWAFGPTGDVALGQQLAASKTAIWSGFASGEVRTWMSAALETCSDSTSSDVMAKLAIGSARTAVIFGEAWLPESGYETRLGECRRALQVQHPEDLRAKATAQYWIGVALQNMGRYDDAAGALREARVAARRAGAQSEYNAATTSLGSVRFGAGDLQEARELIAEVLERSEAANSDRDAADARITLAEIEFASGRVEEALQLNLQAERFFRSDANLIRLPMTLCNSSAYRIALERYPEAREDAHEALRRSRAIGSVSAAFWAMQHLAAIAVFEGETSLHRAAHILGFVDETIRQRGKHRYYTEQQEYDKMLFGLREVFGEDQLSKLMAVGKTWSEEQAFAAISNDMI